MSSLDTRSVEFEVLFHGSPVALAFARDSDCRDVLCNPAMDRIIPPELDWHAWRLPDGSVPHWLKDGVPLPKEQHPLRRAALLGESTHQLEIEIRTPGREPLCALVSAGPVRDGAGAVYGAIAAVVDITAQKRAERERASPPAAASHAETDLLAMLSHDLRNPLNAIATAVEVMNRATPGAPESANARDIIGRQVGRIAHLIDDLVVVGQVAGAEVRLQRQPLPLDVLVRDGMAAAEPAAAAKRQSLRADIAPVCVNADAQRMAQVLARLLDTAIKAAPTGAVIDVHLRESIDLGGRVAVLLICDCNIGREPGLVERLFDPLAQAAGGPDRPRGGLGIEMTLVRRLAELHGGGVEARRGVSVGDHAHSGSIFQLRLPAMTPAAMGNA